MVSRTFEWFFTKKIQPPQGGHAMKKVLSSHEAIQALANLLGAASRFKAAEAFELLRERS